MSSLTVNVVEKFRTRLEAMNNVFAEEEAAEQKGFAGTNPIGWVRMVFLQLLGIVLEASFFHCFLKCSRQRALNTRNWPSDIAFIR